MPSIVRVWDLPTRVFHWALVACVVGSALTAWAPGSWVEWHARLGYAVLSLLLFRVVWGFAGGRWSRFTSFIYAPGSIADYLRGKSHPDHLIGHNPLGSGSVFAMLAFLLAQAVTGLFTDDEIAFTGPLNKFASTARGLSATWYHKEVGKWVLVCLIVLHIIAILYYVFKRNDSIVWPMVNGDKVSAQAAPSSRDDASSRVLALVIFLVCCGCVTWLVKLGA